MPKLRLQSSWAQPHMLLALPPPASDHGFSTDAPRVFLYPWGSAHIFPSALTPVWAKSGWWTSEPFPTSALRCGGLCLVINRIVRGEREMGRGGVSERRKPGGREREKDRDRNWYLKGLFATPPSNFLLSDYPWGERLSGFNLNFEFYNYYCFSPLINIIFPDCLRP